MSKGDLVRRRLVGMARQERPFVAVEANSAAAADGDDVGSVPSPHAGERPEILCHRKPPRDTVEMQEVSEAVDRPDIVAFASPNTGDVRAAGALVQLPSGAVPMQQQALRSSRPNIRRTAAPQRE